MEDNRQKRNDHQQADLQRTKVFKMFFMAFSLILRYIMAYGSMKCMKHIITMKFGLHMTSTSTQKTKNIQCYSKFMLAQNSKKSKRLLNDPGHKFISPLHMIV